VNDHCADATTIALDQPHVDVQATTVRAVHDATGPCAGTDGTDVFFTFTLTTRELVYADTFGATWNTGLYFASGCSTPIQTTVEGDSVCNDDACGTTQSQVVALLGPGTWYLVLSGTGTETGDAVIHFEHLPVGRGTLAQLPEGTSQPSGTTTGLGSLFDCMGAGPENSYWWRTCLDGAGGVFSASTCGGASWDTILSLRIPRSGTLLCDDDTCSVQSNVGGTIPAGAGIQVLTIDGSTSGAKGDYTITVTRP
jgi:hypothetical protein